MALTQSSVTRHIDPSGNEIKALLDDDGTYVQAVALVDEDGDQLSSQHTIGNGNALDVNVRSLNGQASDSFGRLRVSELYPLLETTSRYDIDESVWHVPTPVGAATVTHSATNASIQLSTGDGTSGNEAQLVTLKNFRYQPGKSQLVMQTLSIVNPTEADCDKRWGYFDDDNGLFWGVVNGQFGVGVRNNGVDTFVPQPSFNRDKLDGTGDLGLETDLTKSQIYYISFQYLGVGIVEFGVYCRDGRVIPAHVFQNANSQVYSYMQTAVLPLRYEVKNTGAATSGACGINVLCATVNSDAGYEPLYTVINSVSNDDFVATTNANEIPILSIRAKDELPLGSGVANKVEVVPLSLSIACEAKSAIIRIRENCALTTPVWVDKGTQSAVEYDTSSTTQSGGKVVDTFVLNSDQNQTINLENIFSANKQSLTFNNAGQNESITITIERVGAGATDTSVLSSITWAEIR